MLLVAVDVTVLAVAMPNISKSLDPTVTQSLWISDIYSFVLAGLLVTMGNLGDRWGRKRLLLWGSVAFGATSVFAAFSADAEALLFARVLMGIAGATLMPSTLSLIRNTFLDPRERTIAIGAWSAMGAAGEALGPIVGGILLEHFWWGSIFLINIPVVIVILVIGGLSIRESRNPHPGRIDAISVVLSIVGIFATVGALKEIVVGHVQGPALWFLALFGGCVLGLFVRRQLRIDNPLIDMRLFKRAAFGGAVLADLLSMFALAGMLFLVAQEFQLVSGLSPLQAGVHLLPATAGAIIAAPLAGKFMYYLGRRMVISGGLAMAAVGSGLYAADPSSAGWLGAVGLGFIGVGSGLALTGTADSIMSTAPKNRAGAAAAVSETAYELGTALGIAVLGTVAVAWYRKALVLPQGLPDAVATKVEISVTDAVEALLNSNSSVADAALAAAKIAFSDSVVVASIVGALVLAIGAIVSFAVLPNRAADRSAKVDY